MECGRGRRKPIPAKRLPARRPAALEFAPFSLQIAGPTSRRSSYPEESAMIVSHQHKLIFLKARKVAGTSFEIALSRFCSDGDIITPISRDDTKIRSDRGFTKAQNFNFKLVDLFAKDKEARLFGRDIPPKFYNHLSAKQAKARLPARIWRDYRKVAIVRNPWDRAVSIFFWKNTKKNRKPKLANFTKYFKEKEYLLEINYPNYMIDGQDIVDTYIRYEKFEEDILKLEAEVPGLAGLWDTFKDINAKSETRNREITTRQIFRRHPDVNAQIVKANKWEIEKFGYTLKGTGPARIDAETTADPEAATQA